MLPYRPAGLQRRGYSHLAQLCVLAFLSLGLFVSWAILLARPTPAVMEPAPMVDSHGNPAWRR